MTKPFKRSPQISGYSYPTPDNPLTLPEKLVKKPQSSEEVRSQFPIDATPQPSFKQTISATARSFQVDGNDQEIIRASPISISSTSGPGNLRIIQEIQIRSTGAPRHFPNSSPFPFPSNSLPVPTQLPRIPKQQQSPAITFPDTALAAVLGRQAAAKPVEGFPDGLPAFTPEGVRITLENMFGKLNFNI